MYTYIYTIYTMYLYLYIYIDIHVYIYVHIYIHVDMYIYFQRICTGCGHLNRFPMSPAIHSTPTSILGP